METSPEQPHRRRQHRHLFPVAPETRVPSPDPFNLAEPESLDEYARRQTELFRHLIPHVGSSEALWALESDPVPDDPFDWSVVADQDRPFVAEVLASSDRCCDELLDTEYRTIARRILALVASRAPQAVRRAPRADRFAAGLVWLAGHASGEFGRRSWPSAARLWGWFSVSSCADVGRRLRRTAQLVPDASDDDSWRRGPLALGDATLLHSRYRTNLIWHRDAMLEVARRRRTWSFEGFDGGAARVSVHAHPTKAVAVKKAMLSDARRAVVLVGFGEHVDTAQFFLLSVPDAHELARLLQGALDAPLPRSASL